MNDVSDYKKEYSISDAQIEIEGYLFNRFEKDHSLHNIERNREIVLSQDPFVSIKPDIYCEEPRIIGEIHSHLGKLKPAQLHKIATDILKMNLYEKSAGNCKKYIVVCSEKEKEQLSGNSFVAEAIRQYQVQVVYYELEEDMKIDLEKAMKKQNMLEN